MADVQIPTHVMVATKPTWSSNIVITQLVSAVAMVLALITGNQLDITAEQQGAIIVTIGVIGNAVTLIMRAFFSTTVTHAAAAKIIKAGGS